VDKMSYDEKTVSEFFFEHMELLRETASQEIILAVGIFIAGFIAAKITGFVAYSFLKKFLPGNRLTARGLSRMLELLIVILSIIIALNILEVDAAKIILESIVNAVPSVIVLLLLMFLGFIIINFVFDLLQNIFTKIGLNDYANELGVSETFIERTFLLVKTFLFLILFSVSFNLVGFKIPFFDQLLLALIYGIMLFIFVTLFFTFKEPLENILLENYVQTKLIRKGETVKIDDETGEVIGIDSFGVTIRLENGYNAVIPNREIAKKKFYVKRTRNDLSKLETIRTNFVAQKPAFCGPASASMLLNFFGFNYTQEQIGEKAKTKMPGGTGPKNLINAVQELTEGKVRGVLIKYKEIFDLKNEIKGWLSDGALIILWFSKKSIFKTSKTKGHYVLCVGMEENELIIMDSSKTTAGVYLAHSNLFEEAMSEKDKQRGYLVFAKRGTPSFWRMGEGLIYSDANAYNELSKSFERYLKKVVRKNEAIEQIISEHLSRVVETKKFEPKRVWKPTPKEIVQEKKEEMNMKTKTVETG
jgi:hypothetical protein